MKKIITTLLLTFLFSLIYCFADIYYVRTNGNDNNTGQSWPEAFATLQKALESVVEGDEIWVAEGIYLPTKDINGNTEPSDYRTKTFQMRNGVAIYGGFPQFGEPTMEHRNWKRYETILSGDLEQNDIGYDVNRWDNCFNVFYHPEGLDLDNSAILDGFTITGGHAIHVYPSITIGVGGGMYNRRNSPSILNCKFIYNVAEAGGGAILNIQNTPIISNCIFERNFALKGSGGAIVGSGNLTISNSLFVYNSSFGPGGVGAITHGSGFQGSFIKIINCTFTHNRALGYHDGRQNTGAIAIGNCDALIQNTLIYSNRTTSFDGANEIYLVLTETQPFNKIIIENSCFADDKTNGYQDVRIYKVDGNTVEFKNNINEDPLFVNALYGDFSLSKNSPCVDAGNNEFIDAEFDVRGPGFGRKLNGLDGSPGIVDIGAYEYQLVSEHVSVVEDIKNEFELCIYPNPSSDYITFETNSNFDGEIAIFNVLGEKVYSEKVKNSEQGQINVEFLSNGTYTLVLKSNNGSLSKSFNIIR